MNKVICMICNNKEFNSIKGLSSHIRQFHKISSKDYYDMYLKQPDEGICKVCGNNETNFISLGKGYHKCCSLKCSFNDKEKLEKQSKTFKANSENVKRASKRIITYNISEKGRQNSSKVGKRTGSTNLKAAHNKYDGLHYCKICKQDTKHIIGIGCMTCYNKSESHKQSIINTIKERYGEEYTNVSQVPSVKETIVQTSLERYNITNPGNSRDARIKANKTMRGNSNGSSCEDLLEQTFINLGIKYETQYNKDDRYPFLCDFYLPDTDTFIELNIYWSHNDHFFDINNLNDLDTLNKWKLKASKGHKQYKNAINVWTIKDIKKRNYAITNNLNYLVIWNYEELITYINKLKKSRN